MFLDIAEDLIVMSQSLSNIFDDIATRYLYQIAIWIGCIIPLGESAHWDHVPTFSQPGSLTQRNVLVKKQVWCP